MVFAPAVLAVLEDLYRHGHSPSQLRPALPELEQFPLHVQLDILAKFGEVQPSSITNKAGFLRGIMNRYRLRPPLTVPNDGTVAAAVCEEAQQLLQAIVDAGHLSLDDVGHGILPVIAAQGPKTQVEILKKFTSADLGAVKQKVRFLEGIVRCCTTAAAAGSPPSDLCSLAQGRLESLVHDGRLKPGDLQGSVLATLAALPPELQCRALDRFQEVNLDSITNKSAFLNGIVKRLAKRRPRPSAAADAPQPVACPNLLDSLSVLGDSDSVAESSEDSYVDPNPTFLAALDQLFMKGRLSRDEFDYELCAEFSDFPEPLAVEILERYGRAAPDGAPNHRTLLQTIIQDYRLGGFPSRPNPDASLPVHPQCLPLMSSPLSPPVHFKLQELLGTGAILTTDITPVWYQELSTLEADDAVDVLNQLQVADLRSIECKTTFLLHAIKETKQTKHQGWLESGPLPLARRIWLAGSRDGAM